MIRKTIILVSLLALCTTMQAQEATQTASIDTTTKKLEKANTALQNTIQKLQKKLIKKLTKKHRNLDARQLDSLITAKLNTIEEKLSKILPDSSKAFISKLCTPCAEIATIQQDLQEKVSLTPPNLDIAKDIKISIKELDQLKNLMQSLNLPDLNQLKSLDLKTLATEKLPISKTDLTKLQSSAANLKGLLDNYAKQFEGWEEKLIAQITSIEELKMLQEQQQRIANYKPLPAGYRDKIQGMQTNNYVKEQLEAKAEEYKKIGKTTLQEKLDQGLAQITKAKTKFPSLESLKDAPKRPPNPLKGEPLIKRLKLGGDIQVNKQNPTSIDLSLQVGYLLNPKAQLGIGAAYRISTGDRFKKVDFNEALFTSKIFFNHFVYKTFYTQAIFENNRIMIKDQNDISNGKQWVQSGMVGIGKEFPITKKMKGSTSILYNLLHDEKSPYQKPWVFRVGFIF